MKKKILIATGIYPPDIGGPAQYAVMLRHGLETTGHVISVCSFGSLMKYPSGLRHVLYACKILRAVLASDVIICLDTFSAALPATFLGKLFGKKVMVRVGGDFLWEKYLDRVREPILLSEFYTTDRKYTSYEQKIFDFTKYIFDKADAILFSTTWQQDNMVDPYTIEKSKVYVVENEYQKLDKRNIVPKKKVVLSPSRDRYLKNKAGLTQAVHILQERFLDLECDTNTSSHQELLERILQCYCLVVPSISEVSPNIVIESICRGVPVVCTQDCGIKSRLGDAVVWVDTRNPQDIARAVTELQDAGKYAEYMARISKFDFVHTAADIVREFESIIEKI